MADRAPESVTTPPITADVAGNRLELLETGEARLRALLSLIGGAQRSVKILMYMFNPDEAGERVRDALVEAARRGIDVKLLIDGFGSAAGRGFFTPPDHSGGKVWVVNPAYGPPSPSRN